MDDKNQADASTAYSRIKILLLVCGIVLIASNLRPAITSVGPVVGDIQAATGLSGTLIGLLTTLPVLAFAGLSISAPKISRRFGIEYTLLGSLVVLTAGILIRSLPSVLALYTGTALLGVAIAVGNVLLPSLVKREFPTRIGLMTGTYTTFMNAWAALGSGLSVPIAQGLGMGWRGALACWAILSAVAIIAWLPQLKRNGLAAQHANTATIGYLLRSTLAWQVTFFMGLQSFGYFAAVSWLPELILDRGIDIETAGWLLFVMQIASLPAAFLVPVVAGRMANQKGVAFVTVLFSIIGYGGFLFGGTGLLVLWIILIGLGQGAGISLSLTLFGLRSSNPQQAADLSGMAQSFGYLLAASGPILFGFFHDVTNNWFISLLLLFAGSVVQLLMGLGAGRNIQVASVAKGTEAG